MTLSVYDSIIFGRDFCPHQADWFTGTACSVLGVVSTVGSQVSLFAMTALSIMWACKMTRNDEKSSQFSKRAILQAILLAIGILVTSLAIATIPLMSSLEDYFVQGMFYDTSYKVFIGFPNKERHIRILQTYFNNTINQKNVSHNITAKMTWSEIGQKVDSMFSHQYGTINRTAVHFYGNDGFCLFKYFVRSDDARRGRQDSANDLISDHRGNAIVWLMLGVNLTCFILVTICYALMISAVGKSAKQSGSRKNIHVTRDFKELQTKITIIIVTDFLCWVPFIIISALHNLKVINATFWYDSFAMIVLPLNSVINPLIYDKKIREFISAKIRLIVTMVSHSRIAVFMNEKGQSREGSRNRMKREIERPGTATQISSIGNTIESA